TCRVQASVTQSRRTYPTPVLRLDRSDAVDRTDLDLTEEPDRDQSSNRLQSSRTKPPNSCSLADVSPSHQPAIAAGALSGCTARARIARNSPLHTRQAR